jgi:hypothetical protein
VVVPGPSWRRQPRASVTTESEPSDSSFGDGQRLIHQRNWIGAIEAVRARHRPLVRHGQERIATLPGLAYARSPVKRTGGTQGSSPLPTSYSFKAAERSFRSAEGRGVTEGNLGCPLSIRNKGLSPPKVETRFPSVRHKGLSRRGKPRFFPLFGLPYRATNMLTVNA